MLEQYFGFGREPFGASPDPRCLYLSHTHREALASLDYACMSNRGFTALIAPPGMGKTTLLFRFLDTIRDSARSAFIFDVDPHCDPQELVAYILRDLGVSPASGRAEMHEQLTNALAAENRAGRRVVVVIDEAQNLSDAMLERLRLLTNFETSQEKLMQVVLSGQPSLADNLRKTSLVQLRQRIATISRIEPLLPGETSGYIKHRLNYAGYSDENLFTKDAVVLIAEASEGIPRTINTICFNALSLCYARQARQVDRDTVFEAVSDLQLCPAPRESAAEDQNRAATLHRSSQREIPVQRKRARLWKVLVPVSAVALLLGFAATLGLMGRSTAASHWAGGNSPATPTSKGRQLDTAAGASVAANTDTDPSANDPLQEVVVAPNQGIAEISKRYLGGYDLRRLHQIQALNPEITDPNEIRAGQKILLPKGRSVQGTTALSTQASGRTAP